MVLRVRPRCSPRAGLEEMTTAECAIIGMGRAGVPWALSLKCHLCFHSCFEVLMRGNLRSSVAWKAMVQRHLSAPEFVSACSGRIWAVSLAWSLDISMFSSCAFEG
jgi:hypothetical protein